MLYSLLILIVSLVSVERQVVEIFASQKHDAHYQLQSLVMMMARKNPLELDNFTKLLFVTDTNNFCVQKTHIDNIIQHFFNELRHCRGYHCQLGIFWKSISKISKWSKLKETKLM